MEGRETSHGTEAGSQARENYVGRVPTASVLRDSRVLKNAPPPPPSERKKEKEKKHSNFNLKSVRLLIPTTFAPR